MAPWGKRESSVARQPLSRSAVMVGFEWASRVSTIAASFSLPPVIGFGIDRWSGSGAVATLIGVVLGFVAGLMQILRLSRDITGTPSVAASRSREDVTERGVDRVNGQRNPPDPPRKGA
jgi:Putative F0F1-ATPase subunit Ca2+/Mg2+ transporter